MRPKCFYERDELRFGEYVLEERRETRNRIEPSGDVLVAFEWRGLEDQRPAGGINRDAAMAM